ncbi:scaffold attachment factor B1 isoform X2 [Aricia agestis]|uniref:scaffold attachment factor B1 isoform X2 n=1 Tax=Aricia agestis TaxID=91739 RepID=UPI001C2089CE|nr:scaffold attachment factor B1 isoform X2 [Aricia agestis]
MSDRKRLLEELRVIDLRAELEKRNLDKSGIRSVLIQRLTKYLEEQGEDPATYKFELGVDCKTPSKRTRRTESSIEPESEDTPAMEDMIVQDAAEDDEAEGEKNTSSETQDEAKMEVEGNDKSSRKRESTDDCEPTPAKKPCLDQQEKDLKQEEDHKGENNTDAEDSINLDLGDDELLNEETDHNATKMKKDDERHEDTAADGSGDPAPKDGESADAASSENQVNNEATTNSHDTDNDKESRNKDDKDKEGDDKKDKKDDGKEGGARNLWVSGLSSDTRAKDLKQLCSKHGKVIGAKVVTNARTPGSRCYGYVTMATAQDAENCIKNLHRTELHGRMISVEKAKSESESSSRRQPAVRTERRPSKEQKEETDKEGINNFSKNKKDGDASGGESARSTSRTREKSHRSEKDRAKRSTRSRERRRSPREVLSFSKIWKERDDARARERSRAAREDERRRRAAEEALRERERRQRQEKHRLNIEREKLRAEREKIEREKNELLRLERERHRLEREKLELERLELKRAQLRLEEERRKRGYDGAYRKPAPSPPPEPAYERERHKRAPPPQMVRTMPSSRGQFEAPPPPRFELAGGYERGDKRDRDRDYKRDYPRHVPSNNMKYPSNGSATDDARQPIPPGTRPKEPSRTYESRDSRSYRPSPPGKPEPRNWSASNRYPDAAQPKGGGSSTSNTEWSGEARYAGGAQYEPRYGAYQPPPPGATYPDRYAQPARDYPRKY